MHILASVCLGIPSGNSKQDDMGKQAMDELIAYAGKHHADLLRTGHAHGVFDPKGGHIRKLAPKFKSSRTLTIIGASQARTFANQLDLEKGQILSENNWSAKKLVVLGAQSESSQRFIENAFRELQRQ